MLIVNRDKLIRAEHMPLVIDYDFMHSKPRGGSVLVDFFSFGKLMRLMDSIDDNGNMVYVMKGCLHPFNTFFLIDFAKIHGNIASFVQSIENLDMSELYIEESDRFNIVGALSNEMPNLKIIPVSII